MVLGSCAVLCGLDCRILLDCQRRDRNTFFPGICQCARESSLIFDVVPAWPDYDRREAFANAASFTGRMLTVSYCGRTAAGVPRCASGIGVRAAEDIWTDAAR